METFGRAQLGEGIPAGRAVVATLPRAEIMTALEDPDERPELWLDLARHGGTVDDHRRVAIEWSPSDLEQLLEGTEGDDVGLVFDLDELGQAFDDVEAHGFRERTLVVAAAAAGAFGTGATIANAMAIADVGAATPATAPAPVSDAASGGGFGAVATASDGGLAGIGGPSTTDEVAGAAALIVIAGAAFAVRRRPGAARPA